MKRYAVLMALSLVLAMATAADAQRRRGTFIDDDRYLRNPHRYTLFFDAGLSIPTGPGSFSDTWGTTLPLHAGAGLAIFPWFDVNVVVGRENYSMVTLEAKRKINFLGVDETNGGSISTTQLYGSVRFLAVPEQQLNPFVEIGVGYFKISADEVVTSGEPPNSATRVTFTNRMEDVSGLATTFGAGGQYALNNDWSTYVKFMWTIHAGSSFAPSDLVLPLNGTPGGGDGNQQFANVVVGLMIRI